MKSGDQVYAQKLFSGKEKRVIRVGSRDSALAVVQSKIAIEALKKVCPEVEFELITMKTTGDKILDRPLEAVGGRGLFVKELDQALYEGRCDLTVHSLKDMPLSPPEELPVLALLDREDCRDVLVLRNGLSQLPEQAVIGTSSQRRILQGKRLFPGAIFKGVRGNLNTRLRKLDAGEYDALILAAAGLIRLGFEERISRFFSVEEMIPSAGQGILAIQGRRDESLSFVRKIHSKQAAALTRAEQAFVAALGGGCSSPTAASAVLEDGKIRLRGLYYKEETDEIFIGSTEGTPEEGEYLGRALALKLEWTYSSRPGKRENMGETTRSRDVRQIPPLGKVYLVGSGPGDAGLMTLRGRKLLEQADAVIYDALAGDAVLGWIPEGARKVDVGKRSGHHSKKQEEILEILLEEAKKGGTIVRLKGGDPFVFGRGGEEAEFLRAHQIPFEVVPGISSSLAVPAYFGIPVTHRGLAGSFHVITGHRMEGMPDLDFEALARVGGTLIFLMGVGNAARICEGLMKAGMSPETPAAFLMDGTLSSQRKIQATLQTLPEEGVKQGVKAPAILLIGEVCRMSENCAWSEQKPLSGKRIVITRPRERSPKLAERLRLAGAEVLEFPTIALVPRLPLTSIHTLETYSWLVLTSPAGAEYSFQALREGKIDLRRLAGIRIAVIGEGTASVCRAHGIEPDYIPERFYAEDLGKGLAKRVDPSEKVLILRAAGGSRALTDALTAAGISYTDEALYDTVTPEGTPLSVRIRELLGRGEIDAVTFTSGSTVRGFLEILRPEPEKLTHFIAVCIGEKTEEIAKKAGMHTVLADSVSEAGLEQAMYHL